MILINLFICWLFGECCMVYVEFVIDFFFFKQKTAYEMRISDWSSDVCSSDLCVSVSSQSLIGPADTPAVLMQTASDPNTLARTGRKTGRLLEHIRPITDSGATLHRMIAKPAGKLLLRQFASGKGEKGDHKFSVAGVQSIAVQHEEGFAYDCCSTLVAVHKRVIPSDAIGIAGSKLSRIGVAICGGILWSGHGAFQ